MITARRGLTLLNVKGPLVVLENDERGKAIRMLTALNETINRETEALGAK